MHDLTPPLARRQHTDGNGDDAVQRAYTARFGSQAPADAVRALRHADWTPEQKAEALHTLMSLVAHVLDCRVGRRVRTYPRISTTKHKPDAGSRSEP